MFRDLLHYLSRGVVIKRHLPADFGSSPIYVSPDAALSFWKRDLERIDPFLFRFARQLAKPGMTVWDVGANVGLFTFAAAAKGCTVLAIEADFFLAGLIERSVAENACGDRVNVIRRAVSDRAGTVTFNISKSGRCANYVAGFGTEQSGGARASVTVPAISLDGLLAEGWAPPDLVKIDIEGMDHIALRGADRLLSRRPTLILEVSDANRFELSSILQKHQYQLFDTDLHQVRKMPLCNVVAMPAA